MLTNESGMSSDTAASSDAQSGNNSSTQIAEKGIWISLWEARSFWVSVCSGVWYHKSSSKGEDLGVRIKG